MPLRKAKVLPKQSPELPAPAQPPAAAVSTKDGVCYLLPVPAKGVRATFCRCLSCQPRVPSIQPALALTPAHPCHHTHTLYPQPSILEQLQCSCLALLGSPRGTCSVLGACAALLLLLCASHPMHGLGPRDLLVGGWSGESFTSAREWSYLRASRMQPTGAAAQAARLAAEAAHSGPDAWHTLRDSKGRLLFPSCAGKQQSPIDLRGSSSSSSSSLVSRPLHLTVPPAPLRLASQHTAFGGVQFFPLLESNVTWSLGGLPLHLRQFHFHSPSEHTLAGQHYAMELHLVFFKDGEATPRAVLGVLFPQSAAQAPHAALQGLWAHLHRSEHHTHDNRLPVDGLLQLAEVLAGTQGQYYRYPGSLTTPPCSEGVDWHVAVSSVGVSRQQVAHFEGSLLGAEYLNYRDVQPLNGRVVEVFSQ